jgi:hypothetical protein
MQPEQKSIGELAYQLWLSRGCPEGTAEQDWLDAERQLRASQRASDPPAGQGPGEPAVSADAKSKAAQAAPKKSTRRSRSPSSRNTDNDATH